VSQENVDLYRRLYAVFNRRDLDAFLACFDPQIEFHSIFAAVGGVTVYRGYEGLRRWNQELEESWGYEVSVEPEAYFDLGEQTLVLAMMHGRGRQSGLDTTMPFAQVASWRDGMCVRLWSYSDREDALRALGVLCEDLEPIAP
jgi:ketosteroid isomerase-like protein